MNGKIAEHVHLSERNGRRLKADSVRTAWFVRERSVRAERVSLR